MTNAAQSEFSSLQTAWLEHQALKTSGASVAVLAASRERLDEARLSAYRSVDLAV